MYQTDSEIFVSHMCRCIFFWLRNDHRSRTRFYRILSDFMGLKIRKIDCQIYPYSPSPYFALLSFLFHLSFLYCSSLLPLLFSTVFVSSIFLWILQNLRVFYFISLMHFLIFVHLFYFQKLIEKFP